MEEWCYEEEDWTEKLIRAVKSKPALYDTTMKDYSNRAIIKKLWSEVCETIHENWNDLSTKERAMKGNEVQSRWRNLRTCFKRELNKQKNAQSTQGTRKRRRYVYFNKLLFLLPMIEDKDIINIDSSNQIKEELFEEAHEQEDIDIICDDYIEQQNYTDNYQTDNETIFKRKNTYPNQLPNILNAINETEIDEDVLFLLSLVPSFQKFTEDQKFDAKMEFLKVIKRTLAERSNLNSRRTSVKRSSSVSGSKGNCLFGDRSSNSFQQTLPDCSNADKSSAFCKKRAICEYSSDES